MADLFVAWVLYDDGCASFPCNIEVTVVVSEVGSASGSASREDVAVVTFFGCFGAWARELDAWRFSRSVGLASAGGTSAVLSSVESIFRLVGGVVFSGSFRAAFLPLEA